MTYTLPTLPLPDNLVDAFRAMQEHYLWVEDSLWLCMTARDLQAQQVISPIEYERAIVFIELALGKHASLTEFCGYEAPDCVKSSDPLATSGRRQLRIDWLNQLLKDK